MKNDPAQETTHHVIPTSRVNGKGILSVCKVPRLMHESYHSLFGNMKPSEIVEYLNNTFWNNTYTITIKKTT